MGKRIDFNTSAFNQVFDDLDRFLAFCRDYGYVYNEEELYSNRSAAWRQFQRFEAGKSARNQWEEDSRRLAGA